MTHAVDIRDAFVIYPGSSGGTAALQGLTLTIEPGEIVVMLGPSGSGKTTLLRVVAGFERLSAGSASVFGTDVARIEPRAADRYRAHDLGLLDQHYARSLSPDLTCRQTVALQLELLGHEPVASREAAGSLLDWVGLGDRADELPGALSGGEQQRVAVCAAIAHKPRLLLADEPAGELDAANGELVYRLVGDLVRERAATALIVSHDAAAATIADRIVHVRDGRVVEESRRSGGRALVVGRGGWIRLPEAQMRQLGFPTLLEPQQSPEGLVLTAGNAVEVAPEPASEARSAGGREGGVVVEVVGASRRYGSNGDGRVVFAGLDLSLEAGRFAAIVGRSGSGKTTLLHLIAGLERPSDGDVKLFGVSLNGLAREELAALRRRYVSLVTQEPGLVPYLSAAENVELALHIRSASGGDAERGRQALVAVGLEQRLGTPAARLSAGERQRVAIARALAVDAPLLLVDEPTARLDEENGYEVARLLVEAAHDHGLAVACATHDSILVERADETVALGA